MSESKTVATMKPSEIAMQPANMNECIRLAELMCQGKLVPTHLQNSPGDCLMVIEQSLRWHMSPFAVAQCTSIVKGRLNFEGKLVAAAIEASGILSGLLDYQFSGEGALRKCTVSATRRGEKDPRSVEVVFKDVRTDNGMWVKQPDQQLVYSGARTWARRWAPGVMLGVYTPEEFDGVTIEAEPAPSAPKRSDYIGIKGETVRAEPEDKAVEAPKPPSAKTLEGVEMLIANTTTFKDDFAWAAAYEKSKATRAKLAEKYPDLSVRVEAAFQAARPRAAENVELEQTLIQYPLFNQFGEEDDGPSGAAQLPVQFARDFERVYVAAKPDDRVLLGEFNEDSIQRASDASPEAKKIIAEVMARVRLPADVPKDSEDRYEVARTKTPKGGWDVVAWVNTAKAVVAALTSLDEIDEMYKVNSDTIGKLPPTARTILENAVNARRECLTPVETAITEHEEDVPGFFEDIPDSVGLAVEAAKDQLEILYDQFCADIANAKHATDLYAISSNAAMKVRLKQIKENRPDLAERLAKKYAAKDAEIKGAK